jgi:8-oxo-dGTP pyrophosphatase MutT (NUDIX family)
MPHIHTESGQIDFIAEVFVVYKNKVLIRLHDKVKRWIAPGGHIELDETPEEAAVREIKEEIGLDVVLYQKEKKRVGAFYNDLNPPLFMNVIQATPEHRHLHMIYFATSDTDNIIQPEDHEKTQCRWMTKEDIFVASDMDETIKTYALKALKLLAF